MKKPSTRRVILAVLLVAVSCYVVPNLWAFIAGEEEVNYGSYFSAAFGMLAATIAVHYAMYEPEKKEEEKDH